MARLGLPSVCISAILKTSIIQGDIRNIKDVKSIHFTLKLLLSIFFLKDDQMAFCFVKWVENPTENNNPSSTEHYSIF